MTALPGRIVEAGDEHERAGLVRALISRVGDCLVIRGVKGTFSDRMDAHLANAVDDPGGNSPGLATSLDFAPQSIAIASLRARGCGAREVTPGCRPGRGRRIRRSWAGMPRCPVLAYRSWTWAISCAGPETGPCASRCHSVLARRQTPLSVGSN